MTAPKSCSNCGPAPAPAARFARPGLPGRRPPLQAGCRFLPGTAPGLVAYGGRLRHPVSRIVLLWPAPAAGACLPVSATGTPPLLLWPAPAAGACLPVSATWTPPSSSPRRRLESTARCSSRRSRFSEASWPPPRTDGLRQPEQGRFSLPVASGPVPATGTCPRRVPDLHPSFREVFAGQPAGPAAGRAHGELPDLPRHSGRCSRGSRQVAGPAPSFREVFAGQPGQVRRRGVPTDELPDLPVIQGGVRGQRPLALTGTGCENTKKGAACSRMPRLSCSERRTVWGATARRPRRPGASPR